MTVSELGKVIVELKESLSSYTSCVRPHEGGVQGSSASGGIEKSAEGNSLRKSKKHKKQSPKAVASLVTPPHH